MSKDVRPRVPAKHKEHEDIEQSQEVNIDSADTLVSVVPLKNGHGVEGHGCHAIPCGKLVRSFHFAIFTPQSTLIATRKPTSAKFVLPATPRTAELVILRSLPCNSVVTSRCESCGRSVWLVATMRWRIEDD